MPPASLLLATLGIHVALMLLDLIDRGRAAPDPRRPAGASVLSGVALAGFTALFLAVEGTGHALSPRLPQVLEVARRTAAEVLGRAPAPPPGAAAAALVSVVAFYLAGFFDYWIHRLLHHPWVFPLHEYHHLPRQVFLGMPGITGRPFAALSVVATMVGTVATLYLALGVAGLPAYDLSCLVPLLVVWGAIGSVNHSCVMRRNPWIHAWMRPLGLASPQEHVLHHARDLQGNYGNFTTLWDRVFGTYLDPSWPEHQDPVLGLPYPQDLLGTLTLGRLHLPPGSRLAKALESSCGPGVPSATTPSERESPRESQC